MRNFLSDFAVIIAILTMTLISFFSDVHTPKLVVPSSFKPTWEGRDWLVTHALIFPDHILANPWYVSRHIMSYLINCRRRLQKVTNVFQVG